MEHSAETHPAAGIQLLRSIALLFRTDDDHHAAIQTHNIRTFGASLKTGCPEVLSEVVQCKAHMWTISTAIPPRLCRSGRQP